MAPNRLNRGCYLNLLLIIVLLLFLSAFFSASETGLMGVNRYRINHAAKQGDSFAMRISQMLRRPDRTLSVILMGNTAANLILSSLATILAARYFGSFGIMMATVLLTMVVLIFVEIAPKTYAALYPERICRMAVYPLTFMLKIMDPFVVLMSVLARGILWLVGVSNKDINWVESLGKEELKSVIKSTNRSDVDHEMMVGVLDLNDIRVRDVMLPRTAIVGVDVSKPWAQTLSRLAHAHRINMLVYDGSIERPLGIVSLNQVFELAVREVLTQQSLMTALKPVYYVPEGTSLLKQLANFKQGNYGVAMVVDEYGDVKGMIAIEDIIEEVVGEYAGTAAIKMDSLKRNSDGSFWLLGTMSVRDLNRSFDWALPDDGPNTISGLMIEALEIIPEGHLCIEINGNRFEVVRMRKNRIELIKFWPKGDNKLDGK